jgi:hypothetical protein
MSLTECKSDTTQKLKFGVSTTIEPKYMTSENTGILLRRNIARKLSLLSDVAVTLLS